jgi:hypothetical protein
MKMRKPCQLTPYGLEVFEKQRRGLIVGESRNKECWWVKWNGNKLPTSYAKEFIELRPLTTNNTEEKDVTNNN